MTAHPVLQTPHLVLRPFDETRHLTDTYVAWLNDPDVVRFSEQRHRHHTLDTCRDFVGSFTDSPSVLWAIEIKGTGRHIGNIHADIDPRNGLADVAIMIGARDVWGRGYGLEAWAAVTAWLGDRSDIRKITAGCMASNAAMRALMARSGMKPDGQRAGQCLRDGKPEDVIYAAIFLDR